MNIFLLLLLIGILYRLIYSTKDKFSLKRGVQKQVKRFAKLTPINRKVLIPVKDAVSGTLNKISSKPTYISGKISTTKPRSLFKNDPTPRSKSKKSVWWHPALITGAIIGGAVGGMRSGELYNKAKRGEFVKRYEIYNPLTKKYEYYRIGASDSVPEDDRLFVKYDGPPKCDTVTGDCKFVIEREDIK